MDRRTFVRLGVGATVAGAGGAAFFRPEGASQGPVQNAALREYLAPEPPAYSVIPVVGDGKWIWKTPPTDQTGYLQPRNYDLKLGIELEGTGSAGQIKATTAAPVNQPGQEIEEADVETRGCQARLRAVSPEAGQLFLSAPAIAKGQFITAMAHFRITLLKEYHGYTKEQFPVSQGISRELRKAYLSDSPGIQTRMEQVRNLSEKVSYGRKHPWEKAQAFQQWVWKNIRARIGNYTSVVEALRDRVGDCEERACVFVALCRAAGIPARQVWVPNHAWAEFFLHDEDNKGYWIPAHTACYSWFGWTGAHELILQKGDRISVPEKRRPMRLLADWMQWKGAKPKVRYHAELVPLPPETGGDAGPGARRKDALGRWQRTGKHPLDRYTRV